MKLDGLVVLSDEEIRRGVAEYVGRAYGMLEVDFNQVKIYQASTGSFALEACVSIPVSILKIENGSTS